MNGLRPTARECERLVLLPIERDSTEQQRDGTQDHLLSLSVYIYIYIYIDHMETTRLGHYESGMSDG
jgi:hypothetical protein